MNPYPLFSIILSWIRRYTVDLNLRCRVKLRVLRWITYVWQVFDSTCWITYLPYHLQTILKWKCITPYCYVYNLSLNLGNLNMLYCALFFKVTRNKTSTFDFAPNLSGETISPGFHPQFNSRCPFYQDRLSLIMDYPWENKWSSWAHRELTVTTVVTAPAPNDHGSVTARLGHSSVTARSQLNHGDHG